MKTITVSRRARTLNALLSQALEELADFDREVAQTRQNEELMRLLDSRGQEEVTVSLEEARARLYQLGLITPQYSWGDAG